MIEELRLLPYHRTALRRTRSLLVIWTVAWTAACVGLAWALAVGAAPESCALIYAAPGVAVAGYLDAVGRSRGYESIAGDIDRTTLASATSYARAAERLLLAVIVVAVVMGAGVGAVTGKLGPVAFGLQATFGAFVGLRLNSSTREMLDEVWAAVGRTAPVRRIRSLSVSQR